MLIWDKQKWFYVEEIPPAKGSKFYRAKGDKEGQTTTKKKNGLSIKN